MVDYSQNISNLQIINLPITPYNDDVASYINTFTLGELYRLFNERNTADVLTAALYGIYQSELNLYNGLTDEAKVADSWIIDEAKLQCDMLHSSGISPKKLISINPRILMSLGDVFFRDNLLFRANLNDLGQYPNVFIVTVGGLYAGHVYAWTVDMGVSRVTNVIGIRSSFLQIMLDQCGLKQRGIAPMFLNAILQWAIDIDLKENHQKDHYIRFLQPIGNMVDIITKCGFSNTKHLRNSENHKWLYDNLSLGNTPLTTGLIFREYDYIMNTKSSIKCKSSIYEYNVLYE